MKFGMMYLFSEYGSIPQSQVFKEFIEEVELAEELGFDSIWLPEHHFSVYGILGDTLTMAAAIAQRTKKIKIGTAVVLLPLNHPVRVAEQAALVDCLSDGRLLLGVGRAYQPGEFGGFGISPDTSRERFFEAMDILLKCFKGEKFSHSGEFWTVDDVELYPRPVQDPYPPIYMAAVSPPSYQLAAKHGLSILRAPRFTSMNVVQEQFAEYTKYMRDAGRDPLAMDQPMLMQTFVAETEKEAKKTAEVHAIWYHELFQKVLPGAPGKKIHKGYEIYDVVRKNHAKVTYDDLAEWGSAFGDPEQVADRIVTYAQEAGVNHWMAEMKFGGMSHEDTMRSMRLFATEVMPRVNDKMAKAEAAE
ncbi:MAG: LLM class flavin-dependent oxidoreductase [Rhodospirillaceae bacterium]|jgi:alkanesulfonate monooxygenase SsuD/methylene tetrahydromethanopterin reductase-like flavin-dependent oxidoreductase (luciferase family)|nr:LLM class flavin-dependent oxidoreductase [Rhodospirillaceae bacterium]MBT5195823.1 LLM class flavin-dependent oxidoreductase [Rhodospirillaceae bacterium]MBT5895662.1 LLM class flavin-dependent oxidoreductase [Rhodospirillaceae bacterium]MBT6430541.1 LLM class flavin-dependent oxidoreductase [Rhodospirillaceae bacterium]